MLRFVTLTDAATAQIHFPSGDLRFTFTNHRATYTLYV
jgi:hypothetical protein